jgi:hypothetical protein
MSICSLQRETSETLTCGNLPAGAAPGLNSNFAIISASDTGLHLVPREARIVVWVYRVVRDMR